MYFSRRKCDTVVITTKRKPCKEGHFERVQRSIDPAVKARADAALFDDNRILAYVGARVVGAKGRGRDLISTC